MNKNFPGKTLRHVSYPYSRERSCKKSEKSLGRFSRKIVNRLTNRPQYQAWPQLTLRTATWPEGHWLNVRHFHHVTGNKSQTMSSCIKPLHLEKRETFCTLTQPNQIPTTLDIMGENLIFGSNLFNLLLIQLIQLIQLIDLLTCSNLGNIKSIQQT